MLELAGNGLTISTKLVPTCAMSLAVPFAIFLGTMAAYAQDMDYSFDPSVSAKISTIYSGADNIYRTSFEEYNQEEMTDEEKNKILDDFVDYIADNTVSLSPTEYSLISDHLFELL